MCGTFCGKQKNEIKQNKRVVGLKSQTKAFGHPQYESILGITAMFSVFACALSNFSSSSMHVESFGTFYDNNNIIFTLVFCSRHFSIIYIIQDLNLSYILLNKFSFLLLL